MTTELTVLGVVLATKAPIGAVAQMPRLPSLLSFVPPGAQPGGRLVLILGEGPNEVLHLDKLPVQRRRGVQVVAFQQLDGAAEQGGGGPAEVTEGNQSVVAVAEGRGAVDALRPEEVPGNAQRLTRVLEACGEGLAQQRAVPASPVGLLRRFAANPVAGP